MNEEVMKKFIHESREEPVFCCPFNKLFKLYLKALILA